MFCFENKQQLKESIKPTGLTSLRSSSHQSCVRSNAIFEVTKSQSNSVLEIHKPFMSEGSISLVGDLARPVPIGIMRDAGASQGIVLADVLPFSERTCFDAGVLL